MFLPCLVSNQTRTNAMLKKGKPGKFRTWKCLLGDLLLARGLVKEEELETARHVSIPIE